jgi:hypothetical protein
MPRQTFDLTDLIRPDALAYQIATQYQEWEDMRNNWLEEKKEIRDYIFATDTRGTTNESLPWKNSVHIPKLCQIRDNLHANYMAALFPTDRPIIWEGDDEDSETGPKRQAIEAYLTNKMRLGDFETEVSRIVLDFIDYGNCFGVVDFIVQFAEDPITGEPIAGFTGPKLRRISPLDIVFNPTAATWADTPKIIRSLKTLGSLKADMMDNPDMGYAQDILDRVVEGRHKMSGISQGDVAKNSGFQMDGFDSWLNYFQSDMVEILDFYGDIYDPDTQELKRNQVVTIVDRSYVAREASHPSWLGQPPIFHVGWRLRPDNLYAMGPLDNLVGMQYRIDHLENAKADAFDLIVHPVMKITGYVEDFEYGPGERIYASEEGNVEFMRPDTTMLNADTQIALYEAKMEEMAGAPKQAMGQRTPGEKTAYEVQILENGAQRIFTNKTTYFEKVFIEPVLNSMLEIGRRNMGASDMIRVFDEELGMAEFMKITKEDITAKGKIRPVGARHFARNANMIQNLTQFATSALGQDPAVNAHISGKKLAKLMEQLLGMERFELVQDNVRITEQLETTQLAQTAQQMVMEQMQPQGNPNDPNAMAGGPQGAGAVPV